MHKDEPEVTPRGALEFPPTQAIYGSEQASYIYLTRVTCIGLNSLHSKGFNKIKLYFY